MRGAAEYAALASTLSARTADCSVFFAAISADCLRDSATLGAISRASGAGAWAAMGAGASYSAGACSWVRQVRLKPMPTMARLAKAADQRVRPGDEQPGMQAV